MFSRCVILAALALVTATRADLAQGGSPARLDAAAWSRDLRTIATELPRRHPNLFYRLKRESWDSAVATIRRRLPRMTRNQAMVAFMRLVALAHDGHTSINPWFEPSMQIHYYPIAFALFDDGLFVRAAAPEYARLVGAKVIRYGRVSTAEAIGAMARVIPHENEWWVRGWAPAWLSLAEVADGEGLVNGPDQLRLLVEQAGHQDTVTVRRADQTLTPNGHDPNSAIDRTGWVDMRGPGDPPLWLRHQGQPYWFELDDINQLIYVSYRAVLSLDATPNPEFWRQVFAAVDSLPRSRLVIDLRENIGGNSFYNRGVVEGIMARPLLNRPDRLFVIIGDRTFSAAMNLVRDVEHWTNATFVGEPTGNATLFFGDHEPLFLPGSGMTVNVSTLPWYPYDARDTRPFIAPRLFTPLTSAEYAGNIDPAVGAILAPETAPSFADQVRAAVSQGDTALATRVIVAETAKPVNRFHSPEADVNGIGYEFIKANRVDLGILVLGLNAGLFPKSANAWDSFGEALLRGGRRDEAISAYRRALEIDPQFPPSQAALRQLGVSEKPGAP